MVHIYAHLWYKEWITKRKMSPRWQTSPKSHDTSCMRRSQNMLRLCWRQTKRYRNWITEHKKSPKKHKATKKIETQHVRLILWTGADTQLLA